MKKCLIVVDYQNDFVSGSLQPETPVIVDAGCTASHDAHLHHAALDVMAGLQIEVQR